MCFAVLIAGLSGCRASDALTEVIYDQTSDNIDYENENKYLLNDSTAETKDNRVPSMESDKSGRVTTEKQNIVVYSSNPTSPQFTAKKSVWSKDPDFKGIEASETVHFYRSDDPEATEQDIETPPEEEEEEEEEPQIEQASSIGRNTDEGSGGAGESSERGDSASDHGEATTEQVEGGAGDSNDGFEDIPATGPGDSGSDPLDDGSGNNDGPSDEGTVSNVTDEPAIINDSSSNFTELPSVEHVAAFGQAAVIVQMIGGEGALVAADAELLQGQFANVFADEGVSNIAIAWGDGGSPEAIDVDVIEQSGAQLLVVDSAAYTESMTSEQRLKLNALISSGQIKDVVRADLTNTANMKSFVRKIGASLNDSTSIGQAGKTASNAEDYVTFHDNLILECANNNGLGGLAYDGYSGPEKVYELGGNAGGLSNGTQLGFNGDAKYTLLVDAWDSSVSYIGGDWNPLMSGIALSYIGYAHAPVSYYIQAGGLVNNAAARGNATTPGLYPVWQISMLPVLKNPSYVNYAAGGLFDESVTPTKKRSGTAWDPILLTTSRNLASGSPNPGSSYGSTLFPKLIAASQLIKREIQENSDGDEEAYHPFETTTNDVRGARGYMLGSDLYFSCIGAPGASEAVDQRIGDSITDADIVVNPCGLFSSWTEYGSAEGVLEAAWVNDVVNEDSSMVGWQEKVETFYKTFYRYDEFGASDLALIEEGFAG